MGRGLEENSGNRMGKSLAFLIFVVAATREVQVIEEEEWQQCTGDDCFCTPSNSLMGKEIDTREIVPRDSGKNQISNHDAKMLLLEPINKMRAKAGVPAIF